MTAQMRGEPHGTPRGVRQPAQLAPETLFDYLAAARADVQHDPDAVDPGAPTPLLPARAGSKAAGHRAAGERAVNERAQQIVAAQSVGARTGLDLTATAPPPGTASEFDRGAPPPSSVARS